MKVIKRVIVWGKKSVYCQSESYINISAKIGKYINNWEAITIEVFNKQRDLKLKVTFTG